MLLELAHYAERHGISSVPGFARRRAEWVLHLARDGSFLDVVRESIACDACPDLTQPELVGGGGGRSHFLLDSVAVVTGQGDDKERAKHGFFVRLLEEAAHSAEILKPCAEALNDAVILQNISAALSAQHARPTDPVTFRVDGTLLVQDTSWHEWWRDFRATLHSHEGKEKPLMRCLLSGELVAPAVTHPKVRGLSRVGGQASGSSLIGFDKDSFTSFGLEQSTNAACSEQSATIYRDALERLISEAPRPLAGTLVLHWYKERLAPEEDLFPGLFGGDESAIDRLAEVKRVIDSIETGRRPELLANRYYVLEVSGSGGRVMVRDWFEGSFESLARSVDLWFDDLNITRPRGEGLAETPGVYALYTRLVPRRPRESPRDLFDRIDQQLAPLAPRFWRSILQNQPLPDDVASRSLAYVRSALLGAGDDDRTPDNLDRVACSLLKAWYNRLCKWYPKGGRKPVSTNLEPGHPSKAYQAGRMMAVLAEIQRRALGDVGASIIQRYYAAASATPALVIGRLVRTAQFHLGKISKGSVVYFEQLLGEISRSIGSELPRTLSLEEQTLFALGYYQQRAALFEGRHEPK